MKQKENFKPFPLPRAYAIDSLHTHDFGSESRGLKLCSAPVLRVQRVF
jgi:hypothetical protein